MSENYLDYNAEILNSFNLEKFKAFYDQNFLIDIDTSYKEKALPHRKLIDKNNELFGNKFTQLVMFSFWNDSKLSTVFYYEKKLTTHIDFIINKILNEKNISYLSFSEISELFPNFNIDDSNFIDDIFVSIDLIIRYFMKENSNNENIVSALKSLRKNNIDSKGDINITGIYDNYRKQVVEDISPDKRYKIGKLIDFLLLIGDKYDNNLLFSEIIARGDNKIFSLTYKDENNIYNVGIKDGIRIFNKLYCDQYLNYIIYFDDNEEQFVKIYNYHNGRIFPIKEKFLLDRKNMIYMNLWTGFISNDSNIKIDNAPNDSFIIVIYDLEKNKLKIDILNLERKNIFKNKNISEISNALITKVKEIFNETGLIFSEPEISFSDFEFQIANLDYDQRLFFHFILDDEIANVIFNAKEVGINIPIDLKENKKIIYRQLWFEYYSLHNVNDIVKDVKLDFLRTSLEFKAITNAPDNILDITNGKIKPNKDKVVFNYKVILLNASDINFVLKIIRTFSTIYNLYIESKNVIEYLYNILDPKNKLVSKKVIENEESSEEEYVKKKNKKIDEEESDSETERNTKKKVIKVAKPKKEMLKDDNLSAFPKKIYARACQPVQRVPVIRKDKKVDNKKTILFPNVEGENNRIYSCEKVETHPYIDYVDMSDKITNDTDYPVSICCFNKPRDSGDKRKINSIARRNELRRWFRKKLSPRLKEEIKKELSSENLSISRYKSELKRRLKQKLEEKINLPLADSDNEDEFSTDSELEDKSKKKSKEKSKKKSKEESSDESSEEEDKIIKSDSKYKIKTFKKLESGDTEIPQSLSYILKSKFDYKYFRLANSESNSKKEFENVLKQFAKLAKFIPFNVKINNEVCKQELYDSDIDNIIPTNSELHFRYLEEKYQTNIFVFDIKAEEKTKISIEIPRNKLIHVRNLNHTRTCLIIKGERDRKIFYELIFALNNKENEIYDFGLKMGQFCMKLIDKSVSTLLFTNNYNKGNFDVYKNILNNIFIKDLVKNIVGQKFDSYGKLRIIVVKNNDILFSIFTPPLQPLNLPEYKGELPKLDHNLIKLIFKDEPYSYSYSKNGLVSGLWFSFNDLNEAFYVPTYEFDNNQQKASYKIDIYPGSDYQLDNNHKMIKKYKYYNSVILRAFEITRTETSSDIKKFINKYLTNNDFDFNINEEDNKLSNATLYSNFIKHINQNLILNGKIKVKKEFMDGIIYMLNNYVRSNKVYDNYIKDYYLVRTDFKNYNDNIIFLDIFSYENWIQLNKGVHNNLRNYYYEYYKNNKEPIYIKSNDEIFILQNNSDNSFNKSIITSYYWKENQINLGYNTNLQINMKEIKKKYGFIIYSFISFNEIGKVYVSENNLNNDKYLKILINSPYKEQIKLSAMENKNIFSSLLQLY